MSQGKAKKVIDGIITIRSKGSQAVAGSIRAMLALKGFNIANYTDSTPDDSTEIEKLLKVAAEMKVDIAALKEIV